MHYRLGMRGFIYAYIHLSPGETLRLRSKIAGVLGFSFLGLNSAAGNVAAESTPGLGELQNYFDPDIEMLETMLMDALDFIMANPNIYSSFDYQSMLDYMLTSTVGLALAMGVGVVYLFSVVLVVFRSRKNDP